MFEIGLVLSNGFFAIVKLLVSNGFSQFSTFFRNFPISNAKLKNLVFLYMLKLFFAVFMCLFVCSLDVLFQKMLF